MKESQFQFLNPYLQEIHFARNVNYHADEDEIVMHNSFSVQVARDGHENRANVALILESNLENEKAPFQLQITVASDFKWDDLEEKTVENMLSVNAPALLLSYMRPIVANITSSSNFPAYHLPFVNFKK